NGNDATIKAVIQELFIETNKVVYYINPYTFFHNDEIFKNFDNDTKEASLLQACCEILDIKFDYTSNEDVLTKKNVNLKEIKKYGYIGYTYDCETQHIAPRKDVYADKGNQYINDICLQIAKILDNLEEHISQNDEKMGELWKK
ncbi:MAG: hypothetical protein RR444_09835, partial [Oscillospiraceae bacterium]